MRARVGFEDERLGLEGPLDCLRGSEKCGDVFRGEDEDGGRCGDGCHRAIVTGLEVFGAKGRTAELAVRAKFLTLSIP